MIFTAHLHKIQTIKEGLHNLYKNDENIFCSHYFPHKK